MDKIKRYYEAAKSCSYETPSAFTNEQQVVFDAIYQTFSIRSCECALFIVMKWVPLVQPFVKAQLKSYIRCFGSIDLIAKLDAKTI